MTIDEKSFHFFFQSNPTKATELINQVKEVTGSADEDIKRAFDQSKDSHGEFSLQGAVDYLLGSHGHGVVSTTSSRILIRVWRDLTSGGLDVAHVGRLDNDVGKT